jgi:hypothetical protein
MAFANQRLIGTDSLQQSFGVKGAAFAATAEIAAPPP